MGTLNWTVTAYGAKAATVSASGDSASGSFTTSGAAAPVTNLTPNPGAIVTVTAASVGAWVRFGGRTAAVGTGHYIPEGATRDFEVQTGDSGAVSAIEG